MAGMKEFGELAQKLQDQNEDTSLYLAKKLHNVIGDLFAIRLIYPNMTDAQRARAMEILEERKDVTSTVRLCIKYNQGHTETSIDTKLTFAPRYAVLSNKTSSPLYIDIQQKPDGMIEVLVYSEKPKERDSYTILPGSTSLAPLEAEWTEVKLTNRLGDKKELIGNYFSAERTGDCHITFKEAATKKEQ